MSLPTIIGSYLRLHCGIMGTSLYSGTFSSRPDNKRFYPLSPLNHILWMSVRIPFTQTFYGEIMKILCLLLNIENCMFTVMMLKILCLC